MKTRLYLILAALCVLTASAVAETAADIKHRIEQRLPKIDSLKTQEFVGENNRGLLEERKTGGPNAASIVADENRDRETIYAEIANKNGASVESVARARAKQIAANSRGGIWVQDEAGRWFKK
jgi:uncharacterized protein